VVATELGLSDAKQHAVGLRHSMERRVGDRRTYTRGTPDRRRYERRRARLRSLLFTSLALAVPHHLKHTPLPGPVSGPRVSTAIHSIVAVPPEQAYEGLIREAAARYRLDPSLIRSVMAAESAFDPSSVSRDGALGLMQLMPHIAEAFGVEHPFDPRENIMAGAQLLRELLDQHHGDVALAVASYNAGPTAVADYGGVVPPFAETEGYVKRVRDLMADAPPGTND
jgi:soluble lytic murein transglycosylase-like protein